MDRFSYLKQGIAVLLMFTGVKMIASPFIHVPVTASLAVIVVAVGGAVAVSRWRDRTQSRPAQGRTPGSGQAPQPERPVRR